MYWKREKTSGPNGQLSKSTKISRTKEPQWRKAARLSSSLVTGSLSVQDLAEGRLFVTATVAITA